MYCVLFVQINLREYWDESTEAQHGHTRAWWGGWGGVRPFTLDRHRCLGASLLGNL